MFLSLLAIYIVNIVVIICSQSKRSVETLNICLMSYFLNTYICSFCS